MAKSKSSSSRSKKKNHRTVEFVADFQLDPPAAPVIFSPTEREIILADMAYLKQKEVESGDWAKWEADQAECKNFNALRTASVTSAPVGGWYADEWGAVKDCNCPRCFGIREARRT